jgi:hypothetical protein
VRRVRGIVTARQIQNLRLTIPAPLLAYHWNMDVEKSV